MVARANGTVHGRNITLDQDPGLPEGSRVTVDYRPSELSPEEARRLFREAVGGWADDDSIVEIFAEIARDRLTRMPRDVSF